MTDIRRLDMGLLLVFEAVMAARNFTRAAEQLAMTQSAVSQAVGRLRDIFDDPLFIRQQTGVLPTERALEIAGEVCDILQRAEGLLRADRPFDPAKAERTLRIGAWDYENALLAPPLIARLQAEAPGIAVSFRPMIRQQAHQGLRLGEIDLALGRFSEVEPALLATPLYEETFTVIARQGHPRVGKRLTLPRYLAAEHLLVSWEGDFEGAADRRLATLGHQRRVSVATPAFHPAFAMVEASDLLATIPSRLVDRLAPRYGVRAFPLPFDLGGFVVTVLRPARSATDPLVTWVIGILQQIAKGL